MRNHIFPSKMLPTLAVLLFTVLALTLQACAGRVELERYEFSLESIGDPMDISPGRNDLISLNLEGKGRVHRVKSPGWGKVGLSRKGTKIYRHLPGQPLLQLLQLEDESMPSSWLEILPVYVADINFDGEPEFFICESVGASNIFYLLVDGQGGDLSSIFGGKDIPGYFGMPAFDSEKRSLSTWEKTGPVGSEAVYSWQEDQYWLRYQAEPVLIQGEGWPERVFDKDEPPVFHKIFIYEKGKLVKEYLSWYGDTRPLVLTAGQEISLLRAPVAEDPANTGLEFDIKAYSGVSWANILLDANFRLAARLKKGESMTVQEAWQEPDVEALWLLLVSRDGRKRGWLKVF